MDWLVGGWIVIAVHTAQNVGGSDTPVEPEQINFFHCSIDQMYKRKEIFFVPVPRSLI